MNTVQHRVFVVNLFYMISAALLLVMGTIVQEKDLIRGLLITEWILVFLPALIYMKTFKLSFRDIHIKPLKIKDTILIIFITLFLHPVVVFLDLTFMFILKLFINFELIQVPMPTNIDEYIHYIFPIVVSAGICEELFFRGIIMSEYRFLGRRNAIIISALLFGVFHFNFQNIVGPIILGLIFGYLVYRTGSIFAAVIGHMMNNLIALTLGYISVILTSEREATATVTNLHDILGSIIFIGFIALACIYLIMWLMSKISEENIGIDMKPIHISEIEKISWLPVWVVVFAYLVISILTLTL